MDHPPLGAKRWQTECVIVVVCPGQGSQTPGFLAPWLELDGVDERLAAYSEAAGVDLREHGTVSDADTIRDTRVAQPLIVAASLVAGDALTERAGRRPDGTAGHSVGEIAALVGSGVIDAETGMRLVGIRGRAMADAAAQTPTGMSAVLGGDEAAILQRLTELGLSPANYNGGGQLVVAGELRGLEALSTQPVKGTRVIPLQVAGAFHTEYMASAVAALRDAVGAVVPADPTITLWTNRDGSVVDSGARALGYLVDQVSRPVRWDLCMNSFADHGITGLIELAPAGALAGLAKRGLRGVPTVAVKTPDDLEAAVALLNGEAA